MVQGEGDAGFAKDALWGLRSSWRTHIFLKVETAGFEDRLNITSEKARRWKKRMTSGIFWSKDPGKWKRHVRRMNSGRKIKLSFGQVWLPMTIIHPRGTVQFFSYLSWKIQELGQARYVNVVVDCMYLQWVQKTETQGAPTFTGGDKEKLKKILKRGFSEK